MKKFRGKYVNRPHCTIFTDNLLCTITSATVALLLRLMDLALTFALQVYCLPWEVRRGLNVRVRVMVLPEVNGLPTEMLFPPTIILPLENCHSTVGSTARFSTTTMVQVRLYIPPAVDTPSGWIPRCGAGSSLLNKERVL